MKKAIITTALILVANIVNAQSDKGHMCFYLSDGYVTENGDTIQNRHNCGDWYVLAKYQHIATTYSSNKGWNADGSADGFQVGLGYRFVRNNIPVALSLEATGGMLSNRTIDGLETGTSFRGEATVMLETSHLADMLAGRHHDDYRTDWLIIGAGLRGSVTNTVYGGVGNPNRTNMFELDFVARATVQLFSFGKVNRYGHEKVMHAVRGFVEVSAPITPGKAQDYWSGNEAQYLGKQNPVSYEYKGKTAISAGIQFQL